MKMNFFLLNFAIFLFTLEATSAIEACKYWCRKPMAYEFTCCDTKQGSSHSTTTRTEPAAIPEISDTEETEPEPPAIETTSPPVYRTCRYYCVYNTTVYCCDEGNSPLPADHLEHDGRCPIKKEQLCKKSGIFLSVHASKMTTKNGDRKLSHKGIQDNDEMCASDGYCAEDEKCCENKCAKKHTCLKAVYDYDGMRKVVPKKKKYRSRN